MTTNPDLGPSAIERHLGDNITLLRNELREFREEFRSSINQRVTHAEFAAFNQLFIEKLTNLEMRFSERDANLKAEIEDLKSELNDLETEIKDLKDSLDQEKKLNSRLQKQLVYTIIGGVTVAIIGGVAMIVITRMLS